MIEVVLMGRFPHLKRFQFGGKQDLEVAHNALKVTQTLELSERSIHELSGGEKQRVLIARALTQEPTSYLDLKFKREVFRLISALSKDQGLSVVLVSHDIDLSAQYCHRLMILRNGSIHKIGKPDDVVTAANIEAVYDCPVLIDKNPATGRPRITMIP